MSKERELLQRILDYMWEGELADEIKELLAQPEQEPVAWMYDLDMMIHPISNTRSKRFGELTLIDPTDRQQDAVNIRPLYELPPKRELLSNEQKRLAAIAIKQREAHGIGGGE